MLEVKKVVIGEHWKLWDWKDIIDLAEVLGIGSIYWASQHFVAFVKIQHSYLCSFLHGCFATKIYAMEWYLATK